MHIHEFNDFYSAGKPGELNIFPLIKEVYISRLKVGKLQQLNV